MYDVLIRFKLVKNEYIFEAILDSRLSFTDNFRLLENILNIDLNNVRVYDPNKKLFLNRKVPIKELNINYLMYFYLF